MMLNDDCSQAEIARELKIHSATVKKYVKKYYLHDLIFRPGFLPPETEFPAPRNKREADEMNLTILSEYVDALMNYYNYNFRDFLWDYDNPLLDMSDEKLSSLLP